MFNWLRNFLFGKERHCSWEEAELEEDDRWDAEHPELARQYRKNQAYYALKRHPRNVVAGIYSEEIVKEIEEDYLKNPDLDREMSKQAAKRWMEMFSREGAIRVYGEDLIKEIEGEAGKP